jgi:ribosomal protein S12 methylthiotransferase
VSSRSGSARPARAAPRTVSLVTLGCARNEVDSEELAARLTASGWDLTSSDAASVVLVNTCGFIQAAKAESISELLSAAETGAKVAAVGCLAERYGAELAGELPEAQILSFDDYGDIGARLDDVLAGLRRPAHTARDRRKLLPITPAARQDRPPSPDPGSPWTGPGAPWAGPGGGVFRRRLSGGVVAPLKIASGCDRRCSFCAIPSFRGAFVSRRPPDLLAEARWLASQGVRELVLVSENSTSYGKDLGNLRLLEEVLPDLAATDGVERVRISYLQPAEMRPGLIEVIASTPGVADYFDLSFQHASGQVLRAMRRFGDRERFLALLDQVRQASPGAGVRSNFIVGFPGETAADLAELELFLSQAGLDAIGIFGYSDEDGTEAATRSGKLDEAEIARRVEDFADLAEELMAQRAADRQGEILDVLIDEGIGGPEGDEGPPRGEASRSGSFVGRAAHQAPEVDGMTTVSSRLPLAPGDMVRVVVTGSDGVDLMADALGPADALALFNTDEWRQHRGRRVGLRGRGRTRPGRGGPGPVAAARPDGRRGRIADRRPGGRGAHRHPGSLRVVPRGGGGLRHRAQGDAARRGPGHAGPARSRVRAGGRGHGRGGQDPPWRDLWSGDHWRGRPGHRRRAAGGYRAHRGECRGRHGGSHDCATRRQA